MSWQGRLALFTLLGWLSFGQAPDPPSQSAGGPARIIGEVTAVDAPARKITIKSDSGGVYAASVESGASLRRVPPDARDLKNAAPVALTEVVAGDRVIVRGAIDESARRVAATSVVVMTPVDLAGKQEFDRAEWLRRGVAGTVDSVDLNARTITLKLRGRPGSAPHTTLLDVKGNVRFRRYAPDSVKFADARFSTLVEIQPGDQVRALGNRDSDGVRIRAEEVVSGTFRNLAAQVKSVDPPTGEIQATDLVSRQAVSILVKTDTILRWLPPDGDLSLGVERLPALSLDDLKVGDTLFVFGTAGADPGRLTAISVVTGVKSARGVSSFGEIGLPREF